MVLNLKTLKFVCTVRFIFCLVKKILFKSVFASVKVLYCLREFVELFQIIGATHEILFWLWLSFLNRLTYFQQRRHSSGAWLTNWFKYIIHICRTRITEKFKWHWPNNCSKWLFMGSQYILKFISSDMSPIIQIQA